MALVYDKDGKEYNVPHPVDVAEWLSSGYFPEKPKSAGRKKPAPKKKEE